MSIRFYRAAEQPYGCFSNYERRHPIEVDGRVWRSVEHYCQHARYDGHPDIQLQIDGAKWPGLAKMRAHRHVYLIDPSGWEARKEEVMLRALRAKFSQHADLRELLLATGSKELVEASPSDDYWGRLPDGSGLNRLGVLLIFVREELRRST